MVLTRFLIPKVGLRDLGTMLKTASIGAVIAGVYGIAHDQVTCTLGEEYFTKFKFLQFDHADFGFPPRVFVAEIGFLATWWVGLLSGWFLARIAVPAWPPKIALRKSIRAFRIILLTAFVAAGIGFTLGELHSGDYTTWTAMARDFDITDVPAFVTVAYIHNASYLGGLIGLILAILHLRRIRPTSPLKADF